MKTPLSKDQRGIAHLAIIVLAVIVVGGIGFAAYRVMGQKNDKTENSAASVASSKAISAECLKTYNDKDLCKFTGNYDIENLSYKMTMTSTGADGIVNSSTFLSDGQGNTSAIGKTGDQESAMISHKGISYMKDFSDGKWFKFPPNDTSAPKDTTPTSEIKVTSDNSQSDTKDTLTYKKIGKEQCGKLTCLKYQVIDSSSPDSLQYFWFDTRDYRMQHYSTKDASGTNDMVIAYEKVSISAPSPTKDFTAGSNADIQALEQAAQQSFSASDDGTADQGTGDE